MSDDEATPVHTDAGEFNGAAGEPPDEDRYEGAVPPGYDWPTHGGYLGCLLGLVMSVLVGGFLGTTLFAALSYAHVLPAVVTLLLTVGVFLAVAVGLGRLGWWLGKRFYREYPEQAPLPGADQLPMGDSTAPRPGGVPRP